MRKILLDTHIWLWSILSPDKLGDEGRAVIEEAENELFLSAASSWEIAIKFRLGRLPLPEPPEAFILQRLIRDDIKPLNVEHHHACRVSVLPGIHRDPFDRILIAQAQTEKLLFITADQQLKEYDVEMLLIEK
ncbi:MAG: type II toxin-antitoxin system VapC family toxin [SAR324 cluster bacterium]|nr:type II toxin-antitoxin system VapC family toxin [SAR324 cluster bacterium]